MADTLDDLKRNLQSLANSISSKLNERQGYLDKADEIQKVYDRLARDKKTIKEYRNDIVYFIRSLIMSLREITISILISLRYRI